MDFDIKSLSREYMYKISIGSLRKLGRSIGVKSPSALKKSVLVDEIYAIITGTKAPYVQKDMRGRPENKEELDLSSLNNITTKRLNDDFNYNLCNLAVASQGTGYYVCDNNLKNRAKRGTMVNVNGLSKVCKYPYVTSSDDAFINANLIRDYNIHEFDIVDYVLVKDDSQIKEVDLVVAVNGKPVTETEIKFNSLNNTGTTEDVFLKIDNIEYRIQKGGRNLINLDTNYLNTFASDKIVNFLIFHKKSNIIRLCLDKSSITSYPNIETLNSSVLDNPMVSVYAVNKTLALAKEMAVQNKDVYIVIDNLEAFINAFNANYNESAPMFIKRFLFTSGKFSNGGAITIICLNNTKNSTAQKEPYLKYFN